IDPFVHARVVRALRGRFGGEVELAALHVALLPAITVSGDKLAIHDAAAAAGAPPLIAIGHFSFRTSAADLIRFPLRVHRVRLDGLSIQVPPPGERPRMAQESGEPRLKRIMVDEIDCDRALLVILTNKPGKLPLDFEIHSLVLHSVGAGRPMSFSAKLTNPKPIGDIDAKGDFGPWQSGDPRQTPVSGRYFFTNADLGTIKGIGGILSSQGSFNGVLERIEVQGHTDTPGFTVSEAGHPVPLHTDFSATVDGATSDTYLHPVRATVFHSVIVASGAVTRTPNVPGHDIALDVNVRDARIQDLLRLAVSARTPPLTGPIVLKVKLHLPPGARVVAGRLNLAGTFHLDEAHFTTAEVQKKIDRLSLDARGRPRKARQETIPDVFSNLRGSFVLKNGRASFSKLTFTIPGAAIKLAGNYNLDDESFEFHGDARFESTLSGMTTGVKSFLLRAANPFFKKRGAGAVVPIRITGTKDTPSFKLDLRRKQGRS
ncbi:MAG: AsmA-like C-terminal region-containing protein, partial [Bryobacteraceae bacterium]